MKAQRFVYSYTGEIASYLDSVSQLVRKVRNRGLLMLNDLRTAEGMTKENNAVVLLFRHALALVDAIAELSGVPSVEALKILCRSFLETKCYLESILETDMTSRAVAYQTYHIMQRIRQYEQYDSSTKLGVRARSRAQQDRLFGPLDLSNVDPRAAIVNIQKQINREPYRIAYEKLRKDERLNWYSIDGGPKNMRELCDRLRYPIAYDQLYAQLSESVHGTDAYVDTLFGEKGRAQMHALRAMPGFQELLNIFLPIMLDFLMQTALKILPKHRDRLARFYKNIYKPFRDANVANVVVKVSR